MFNAQDDPLGVGVQQRAKDKHWQQVMQGLSTPFGPLYDPKWDAYFQATEEAAGGRPVAFTGGPSPAGSQQFRGTATPAGFVGTEQYGSSIPRRRGRMAADEAMTGLMGAYGSR